MIAPPYEAPHLSRKRLLLYGALGLIVAWLLWEAATWPNVAILKDHHPTTTAFMAHYQGWGIFGAKKPVEWKWVPYARISPHLKRAVVAGEDLRFFGHHGFDDAEIKAALQDAWDDKELPRGASTLTQQLAKNLWLSPSYNPLRKVKEALLTRQLERNLGKRRILELYLNFAELGPGIYGAEAAARHYFHKSAASLTERQAAELAASLPAPKVWHPGSTTRGYRAHVRTVVRRMARAGWLWGEV
ncbi:MAG TPA: monofunctional biosynthetic peptidoglycan transglycosylase [Thermoanaerobaculia bacterium]|nr:monofunctional biosynthetic peptidoglycan transglycosylase [Thermoanaerobaculia bacterium]